MALPRDEVDVTSPFVLESGRIRVPSGPGLGVTPIPEILEELTIQTDFIPAA